MRVGIMGIPEHWLRVTLPREAEGRRVLVVVGDRVVYEGELPPEEPEESEGPGTPNNSP